MDVSSVTRSGIITSPLRFATVQDGEKFCTFSITSEFHNGKTTVKEETKVMVLGPSVEELKSQPKENFAEAKVVLTNVVAFLGENGGLCCRVTAPEQLHISGKNHGAIDEGETISAEDFFLNAGCVVDGRTKTK